MAEPAPSSRRAAAQRRLLRAQRGNEVVVQLDGRLQLGAPAPPADPASIADTDEAAQIVEVARRRSDELLTAAAADVQLVEEQARQVGYDDGYRAGMDRARGELAAALELVQGAAREGHAVRQQLLDDAEPALVELVIDATRAVVGELIEVDRELVVRSVQRALERAGAQLAVRVRVHPDDEPHVRAALHEGEAGPDWALAADGRVTLGGCIVDTAHGEIDARLDVQLEALADRLRGAVPRAS